MTFQARPSRISAAGSISRKTFGSARRLAQWFPSSWHGLGRLVAAVALAATTLVPAGATTPTAEDGFAPSANAQVVASAIQPDGKIIVGGYFTEVQAPGQNDPVSVGYLARINPDGTIDTSFNPKANGPVKAIHLLPDGDILIGGYFTSLAPTNGPSFTRNRIARLDSDGRVDPDFDPNLGGVSPSLAHVAAISVDSAGRILLGGEFTTAGGASTARMRMARLNPNGSLDTTFSPGFNNLVSSIAIDSSGRIVVGGGFTTVTSSGSTTTVARRRLARLNDAGVVDATYDPSANNLVTALAFQADGKLLAAGNFTALLPNGATTAAARSRIARILDDGTLDDNFRAGLNSDAHALAVAPDGKIIVSGVFRAVFSTGSTAGTRADFIARFAADGTVDATFFPGPSYTVSTFALQADGKLFIGGYFTDFIPGGGGTGIVRRYMARLNEDGSLDTSLNPSVDSGVIVLAGQTNGQILVGGTFASIGGITRRSIARISADGTVDPVFDPSTNGQVLSIAVQPDGKVLIGGFFNSLSPNGSSTPVTRNYLARVNADGTLDTAFNPNPNSAVTTIVLQSDGKILIGGNFTSLTPDGATDPVERGLIARLNSDGTLDTTFSPSANGAVSSIVVESDGKILVGGGFSTITTGTTTIGVNGLARLNTDGTVVTGFSPNANGVISTVRLLADGKIILGGQFTGFSPPGSTTSITRLGIALLNTDGSVVANFDPAANNFVSVIAPLSDGRILVGGQFTGFTPNGATELVTRNYFARLNADGTVDTAFDPNPNKQVVAILPLSGGGALIAGQFSSFRPAGATATQINKGLAKIDSTGAVDISFKPAVVVGTAEVRAMAYQRDGSMILGGSFGAVAGSSTPNMLRMRSEGIVDPQFQAKPNGVVEAIVVRSLITDSSTLNQRIGWLEANGTLRTGLSIDPNLIIDGAIEAIAVQGDGKILVGGSFGLSGPGDFTNLVRFNPDGSLDTAFKPEPVGPVYDLKVQGNGQIIVVGAFTAIGGQLRTSVARLDANGTVDSGFNPSPVGTVYVAAIQSDGKILLGGNFASLSPNGATTPTPMSRIARVNSDGTLDTAFNPSANNDVISIAIDSDGNILIGGLFSALQPTGATSPTTRNGFARLNAVGTLDTAFDPNPNGQVAVIRPLPGGKILVGGFFTAFQPNGATTSTQRNRVALLDANGTVDLAFNVDADSVVLDIGIQSDGSIILGGFFTRIGGVVRNRIARVSATGVLDTTFNPNANGPVNALLVRGDDSIIAGGSFSFRIGGVLLAGGAFTEIGSSAVPYFALLSTDGTPITSAVPAVDGVVRALALQPDGRVVLAGDFADVGGAARARVARLLADDTLDASFNPGADGSVRALAMQEDGRLLLGGTFTTVGGAAHTNIARVNQDGTVDAAFNASTDGEVSAITVQSDGRILVGGSFTTLAGAGRVGIGRLNADGSIDGSFAPAVDGPVRSIALQVDGSVLIGGTFTMVGSTARSGLAKLSSTGALDAGYDAAPNGAVNALLLAQDGKLIVGGGFTQIGGEPRYLIARLSPSTQTAIKLEVGSDKTSLNWLRTGSGPEISAATFEFSTDGREWSAPVTGTRDSGVPGWRAAGLPLPVNTLFYARARANVAGNRGGSTSLIETVRVAFVTSSGGGSGGSNDPPEVPPRPSNFLAETYLSANPELANALFGLADRLDLAWVHYWTNSQSTDTEQIFLPPGGERAIDPKLINLSARSWIGPDERSLIMGVYVADAPAKLLVRALGPSLGAYNIPNPVADPSITVYAGQTPIASNDDWGNEPSVTQQALTEAGVTMASALDSAMVITLQPGSYTFVISSKGGTGVGLGELFLLSGPAGRLTNLSARASVGQNGDILIAGLNRVGVGEILVRGLGPELANHNIVNFLADPFITLHKQNTGTGILANDDWGQVIGAISDKNVRAGALPLPAGSKDSAAYMMLGSGGYTIHVSGAHPGQAGVALIEVFELR